VGRENGCEVGGAVVGLEERVSEKGVREWAGREGERGKARTASGGVGGDKLGGEVRAGGETGGDGKGVDAEERGQRRWRRRREEAGKDRERGRRSRRRHLIAACSNKSFRRGLHHRVKKISQKLRETYHKELFVFNMKSNSKCVISVSPCIIHHKRV
jgi:hypothetical protein